MSAEPGSERDLLELKHAIEVTEWHAPTLNVLSREIHRLNYKFYDDIVTGKRIARNIGELLMLIVSEVAETMEGVRKDLPDTHLPHRKMEEVEMADTLIRIFDYCGYRGLDIAGAFKEKLAYNRTRQDHTHEARRAAHGKKF